MTVIDACAILAFLGDEAGAAHGEAALVDRSSVSAANWSEVAQKVISAGGDWELSRSLLTASGLIVEPVQVADAEWAARRWRRGEGLSLADRLCLALGHRLGSEVLTADRAWGGLDGVRQIR